MGNHLGNMQKCVDGIAVVGAAAGAFPPAMPVGLVFSAASRLITVSIHSSLPYFCKSKALTINRLSQVFETISIVLSHFSRIQLGFLSGCIFLRTRRIPVRLQLLSCESFPRSYRYAAGCTKWSQVKGSVFVRIALYTYEIC